jgi:hypothetical protein
VVPWPATGTRASCGLERRASLPNGGSTEISRRCRWALVPSRTVPNHFRAETIDGTLSRVAASERRPPVHEWRHEWRAHDLCWRPAQVRSQRPCWMPSGAWRACADESRVYTDHCDILSTGNEIYPPRASVSARVSVTLGSGARLPPFESTALPIDRFEQRRAERGTFVPAIDPPRGFSPLRVNVSTPNTPSGVKDALALTVNETCVETHVSLRSSRPGRGAECDWAVRCRCGSKYRWPRKRLC